VTSRRALAVVVLLNLFALGVKGCSPAMVAAVLPVVAQGMAELAKRVCVEGDSLAICADKCSAAAREPAPAPSR